DVPSGLFIDEPTNHTTIRADHTLTLQAPKLSFFFPENHHAVGEWHILDIGLDDEWMNREPTSNYYFIPAMANTLLNKRSKFDHKGTFGHALLVCGAYGKMGAAVLAAKGCLRAGVGLLTAHIPASAYAIMQSSVPEAMVEVDTSENYFTGRPLDDRFTAIGMGCGIGKQPETRQAVLGLLDEYDGPLVLDADALNILAEEKDGFSKLPLHCILTPHPGEFERLAGTATDSFQILEKQRELSKNHQIYIVLKRGNTCITTPEGLTFFNSTGNPGMATGGSGDVLAGFITGLLAQGYASHEAATLGTYLHGLAGDIGAMAIGQNALIASDIIDHLGQAFQSIE
ncbi:MAG: NAD(P)H-hydrate dehydratase, partial [Saprospiraceae bacterium]|nr:NAD(P)H-hydrate dehydratase [Saprospiraceae bacterium]